MNSAEFQWAKKVAQILTAAEKEFEQEVSRLEYKWKVEKTAKEWAANMPSAQELIKHDFFFRMDVHRAMNNSFDVPMAQKSIEEEQRRGWSTD